MAEGPAVGEEAGGQLFPGSAPIPESASDLAKVRGGARRSRRAWGGGGSPLTGAALGCSVSSQLGRAENGLCPCESFHDSGTQACRAPQPCSHPVPWRHLAPLLAALLSPHQGARLGRFAVFILSPPPLKWSICRLQAKRKLAFASGTGNLFSAEGHWVIIVSSVWLAQPCGLGRADQAVLLAFHGPRAPLFPTVSHPAPGTFCRLNLPLAEQRLGILLRHQPGCRTIAPLLSWKLVCTHFRAGGTAE